MNKADLINQISQDQKITKVSAQEALEMTFNGIINLMKNGKNLTLVGFGSFILLNRAAREARNPNTGAVVEVPEKNYLSFKAGELFREAINLKKTLMTTRKKRELSAKISSKPSSNAILKNNKKMVKVKLKRKM